MSITAENPLKSFESYAEADRQVVIVCSILYLDELSMQGVDIPQGFLSTVAMLNKRTQLVQGNKYLHVIFIITELVTHTEFNVSPDADESIRQRTDRALVL